MYTHNKIHSIITVHLALILQQRFVLIHFIRQFPKFFHNKIMTNFISFLFIKIVFPSYFSINSYQSYICDALNDITLKCMIITTLLHYKFHSHTSNPLYLMKYIKSINKSCSITVTTKHYQHKITF